MDIRSMLKSAGMSDTEADETIRQDRLSTEAVMALNKMRKDPNSTSLPGTFCDAWNAYAAAKGSPVRLGHSLDGTPAATPAPQGKLTGAKGKVEGK